jgi:sugar (pentulose or hexulose) kinase
VFALASDARTMPERLERASGLLMLPDVFHHLLSGSRVTEYSAVSTTGCYDMARNAWATDLLDELGVPTHMLPEVVQPGTDVGALLPDLATGRLAKTRVVMPPGHDTASAVVGTPLAHPGGLYISSGTWSLVGIEVPDPVMALPLPMITHQPDAFHLAPHRIKRCTFRRLINVEMGADRVYDVECLYPDRKVPIPLGDLEAATPICNACVAPHIFRPDED